MSTLDDGRHLGPDSFDVHFLFDFFQNVVKRFPVLGFFTSIESGRGLLNFLEFSVVGFFVVLTFGLDL